MKHAAAQTVYSPYRDRAVNLIYNLLFCDNLDLYRSSIPPPHPYPFDLLFSERSSAADLQKVIEDAGIDPRAKILACNRQFGAGHQPDKKELLAVIVEVGMEGGLDALASFSNGTARYINHTGKMVIWETTDKTSDELSKDLFAKSLRVVNQIGPWDKPRRPSPTAGNARITFLVSDGLYFGEAPTDVLFSDPLASPVLTAATSLMRYLTETALRHD